MVGHGRDHPASESVPLSKSRSFVPHRTRTGTNEAKLKRQRRHQQPTGFTHEPNRLLLRGARNPGDPGGRDWNRRGDAPVVNQQWIDSLTTARGVKERGVAGAGASPHPGAIPPPEHVIAGLKATSSGQDLVQLLTPEGEYSPAPGLPARRVARAAQGCVPRHGAGPAVRPRGQRAATAGTAVHLGAVARPGSRPDRRRPGPAAAGHGLPVLSRARRRLVPRHRPDGVARHLPRGRAHRLGSARKRIQRLLHRHRQPGHQRDRLRDGSAARRKSGRPSRAVLQAFRGDHRLLR